MSEIKLTAEEETKLRQTYERLGMQAPKKLLDREKSLFIELQTSERILLNAHSDIVKIADKAETELKHLRKSSVQAHLSNAIMMYSGLGLILLCIWGVLIHAQNVKVSQIPPLTYTTTIK